MTDLPQTMLAVVKTAPLPGPEGTALREIPVPAPGPDEVLVKVLAAGVCGSDRHIYNWHPSFQKTFKMGITYGHEFCGEIVRVGKDVDVALKEGAFVSAEMHVVCHACRSCRQRQYHVCERTKILGVHGNGCFAQYVVVPAWNVVKLDRAAIPVRVGAFLDALGNAVHTVSYTDLTDKAVAVLGFGPLGAMTAAIAQFQRAARVYVTEVTPWAVRVARRWVQDHGFANVTVLDTGPEGDGAPGERIVRETDGGVDVVLEMSGAPAAINQGIRMARMGGHLSLLGLPSRNEVELDYRSVVFKGLSVQGVIGRQVFATWDQMRQLLKDGLDVGWVVTHEYDSFERFHEAMAAIEAGETLKVVFYPDGRP